MTSITVVILTYNEAIHIERCILSVKSFVDKIYVVDSFSTDQTVKIAENSGAEVVQHSFINQAQQFNWALENLKIETEWILRIDADEYIDNKHSIDIKQYLSNQPSDINGLIISRKIVFMGKPLLHGGWYPKWNLRIFRTGHGQSENRWMDEHIVLNSGKAVHWQLDFVDDNLNTLQWWINKHNNYSEREVLDFFLSLSELSENDSIEARFWGNDAERKRWLKKKYLNFPLFIRPFFNFLYRYIVLRGFLDGKQGLIWHFLQGFWYRFLVDAKIYELKRQFGNDQEKIIEFLKDKYNV